MTRAFFIHTIPSRSLLSQSFLSVKTLGLVKHGKRVREEIEGGVKEDYWWGRKVIHLGNSSICPFLFTIHCHWCSTSILPSFHSLNHLSTSKPLFPGLVRDRWVGREKTRQGMIGKWDNALLGDTSRYSSFSFHIFILILYHSSVSSLSLFPICLFLSFLSHLSPSYAWGWRRQMKIIDFTFHFSSFIYLSVIPFLSVSFISRNDSEKRREKR